MELEDMSLKERYDALCYLEDLMEIYRGGTDDKAAHIHASRYLNLEMMKLKKEMKVAEAQQHAIL